MRRLKLGRKSDFSHLKDRESVLGQMLERGSELRGEVFRLKVAPEDPSPVRRWQIATGHIDRQRILICMAALKKIDGGWPHRRI